MPKKVILTDSQKGIYLSCLEPTLAYNLPMLVELDASFSVEKVKKAIEIVLDAHPIHQIRLMMESGEVVETRVDESLKIEEVTLSQLDKQALIRPFDMLNAPLYRIEILHCQEKDYLFVDFHHILFDGFSISLFFKEIADAISGKEIEKETYSLFDYADDEARNKNEIASDKEYYTKLLDGVDVDSNLVEDKKEDEKSYQRYFYSACEFDDELVHALTSKFHVSRSALFNAVFSYLLATYNGDEEVLYATVHNGRNEKVKSDYGMFVKTLPVYFNLAKQKTILEAVQNMKEELTKNIQHSLYSYAQIHSELGINTDILFSYQGEDYYEFSFDDKNYQIEYIDSKDGKENIAIELFKKGKQYRFKVEYRSDLYLEDTISHLCHLFGHYLNEFNRVDSFEKIVKVDETEMKLLNSYNVRDLSKYDRNLTIMDMFSKWVKQCPNKDCVVVDETRYTYKEVDELSNKIAQYILSHGYHKDDVCSILIHRNAYILIASLGVIKAGLVYQPLDSSYPKERLNFMVKDAGAKLVISEEDLFPILDEYKGDVLYLKDVPALPDLSRTLPKVEKEDRFTLLYTSGSTGVPKGVQLTHGNISIFLQCIKAGHHITDKDRGIAYASYGFDANMYDMYPMITSGGTLYVINEDMRLDLKRVNEYLEANQINTAFFTTQVARQFAIDYENHSLAKVTTGGEKLVPFVPKNDYVFYNAYGPTECTVFVTEFIVDQYYHRVPIGKGLDIVKLYVLDKNMRKVPYGASGELYISGPQVAKGYLNRDDQNKIAFLKNPYDDDKDFQRLYKTGDIVRFLKDGTVDFVGRKDGQVKIRGFRIELTEVEAIIREYPGIKDATVNSYNASVGGMFIAAFITSDNEIDIDDLKGFIAKNKPPYMVPEVIMQLEKIPLNQNGKVNKRALPTPTRKIEDIVLPRNEMEQNLFDIVKEVLGFDTFGVKNDIYFLGLTSIGAIKLITLISERLNKDIDIKELRENKTIEQLAKHLLEQQDEKIEELEDYPLSKTQEGILVETLSHENSTIYNIPLVYEFSKHIDVNKLKEAVEKAIDAHPYLKGRIFMKDDGEFRIRKGTASAKVEIINTEKDPQIEPAPFNLFQDELYRAKIYVGKEKNYLFIDTHHIASDGTSLAILFEDINKAYFGKEIEPEKMDGFEYACVERNQATNEEIAKQKRYFESLLTGVDCNSLPRKEYELPEKGEMKTYDYLLKGSFAKTKIFLEKHKLTENAFYNAVFSYALGKFNGSQESLYTTIFNGRTNPRLSRSVVMLVKTLPIYVKAEKDEKVIHYIEKMKEQILSSQEKTLYSFADIVNAFHINAEVMFAYQGDGFIPNELGGEKAKRILLDSKDAKSLFSIDALLEQDTIRLHFEYMSDRYKEETMLAFARLFDCVSSEFITKEKLQDILLVDEESEKEMDAYNNTDDPLPGKSYVDLFRETAAQNKDKLAVAGIDEDITYGELDRRSNQVANALLNEGVKKDSIVILILPRIANAYTATQGVLKSGAAYLPIDPAYPQERISYICEDSEAKIIITTKKLYEEKVHLLNVKTLLLEDILASLNDSYTPVEIDPSSLAYCIYTSGSTGKPKGVMIEHHSLHNYVAYTPHNPISREYKDLCSVTVSLASLSFDLSVQEQMVPLANGLSVVLASEEEILNPLILSKRMKKYGVDFITTTPSYVNNVLDIDEVVEAFKNIHVLDIGAEALPVPLLRKMKERGLTWQVHNGYGPTEATVACTMDFIPLDSTRVTIGYPFANYKAFIIDEDNRRLPFGCVGELLISGAGVGRGYIHRDELTKEKFISFNDLPSYKTGDLARLNYDGKIEFFGRKDNQVKLRGLRIELDEIENQICKYPEINRSVVLVKETAKDGQFLVAYITANKAIDFDDLRKEIGKSLTPYMIPKVFLQIDEIPLTPNGKVDKKALPEPEVKHEVTQGRKPINETQEKLFEIFEKVLGNNDFSIDDDFFSLGGTSLSASKVTMLAMKEGLDIAYSDVFDYPTISSLDAYLHAKAKIATGKEEQSVEEVNVRAALEKNSISFVHDVKKEFSYSNILLLGATGFLGVHVLRELLKDKEKHIYAFVRKGKSVAVEDRVKGILMYYFDDPFEEAFKNQITILDGDLTDENIIEKVKDIPFDIIINCAACVKHFSNDDTIERVNYGGVKNLIKVANHFHKRLIQISTLSVAGENINEKFPLTKRMHENECFFGQDISNKYVNSKIKAEQAILDAIEQDGLDAKIIRVGNLMGRQSDGEFQINALTNNFMNSLKAYKALGAFPIDMADESIDFSPIDEVAKTILLFAQTPKEFTVFHAANSHEVEMGNVIAAMNEYGFKIDMVDMDVFQSRLNEFIQDESKSEKVSSLLSYESSDKNRISTFILSNNTFSIKSLYRLGYKWPITNEKYIQSMVEALATLGYFDL